MTGSELFNRWELHFMEVRRKHWLSQNLSSSFNCMGREVLDCIPPTSPDCKGTLILRVRLATRLWCKVKLQNPETDSIPSMTLMEYLSGEWLF